MSKPIPLQSITFKQICAVANGLKPSTPEADPDETTLRIIAEQHRAGLCSIEDALARAYGLGRERKERATMKSKTEATGPAERGGAA